ncbi:MAG: signal peptidase II [Terracidiphilus sp.]
MTWLRNWPRPRRLPWLLLISALIVAADRLTKTSVVRHIPIGGAVPVAAHFLSITHLANYGGNFGVFAAAAQRSSAVQWELIALNALAMLVILAVIVRFGDRFSRTSVGLALAFGGGLDCLHDRIAFGAVVDFIEVHVFSYQWPDFNLGDIAIVTGAFLIALDYLMSNARIVQPQTPEAAQ